MIQDIGIRQRHLIDDSNLNMGSNAFPAKSPPSLPPTPTKSCCQRLTERIGQIGNKLSAYLHPPVQPPPAPCRPSLPARPPQQNREESRSWFDTEFGRSHAANVKTQLSSIATRFKVMAERTLTENIFLSESSRTDWTQDMHFSALLRRLSEEIMAFGYLIFCRDKPFHELPDSFPENPKEYIYLPALFDRFTSLVKGLLSLELKNQETFMLVLQQLYTAVKITNKPLKISLCHYRFPEGLVANLTGHYLSARNNLSTSPPHWLQFHIKMSELLKTKLLIMLFKDMPPLFLRQSTNIPEGEYQARFEDANNPDHWVLIDAQSERTLAFNSFLDAEQKSFPLLEIKKGTKEIVVSIDPTHLPFFIFETQPDFSANHRSCFFSSLSQHDPAPVDTIKHLNTLLKLKDLQVNLQKIFQEALETPQKSPQEVRRHLLSQIIGAVQQVRDTILPIEAEIETIACSSEEPPTISGVTPTSLFEIEKLQKEIHEILLACTEIFAKDPNNLQALHEKLKNIQVIAEKLDEKL